MPEGEIMTTSDPARALRDAIREVEEKYPLPRCPHGHALRDNSGDVLGPYDCGCGGYVPKVFLDHDARPKPKTKRYCVKCQKDIKPSARARIVRLEDVHAIHPDYIVPLIGADFLVGMDCARQLGMNFTRPELSKECVK